MLTLLKRPDFYEAERDVVEFWSTSLATSREATGAPSFFHGHKQWCLPTIDQHQNFVQKLCVIFCTNPHASLPFVPLEVWSPFSWVPNCVLCLGVGTLIHLDIGRSDPDHSQCTGGFHTYGSVDRCVLHSWVLYHPHASTNGITAIDWGKKWDVFPSHMLFTQLALMHSKTYEATPAVHHRQGPANPYRCPRERFIFKGAASWQNDTRCDVLDHRKNEECRLLSNTCFPLFRLVPINAYPLLPSSYVQRHESPIHASMIAFDVRPFET